MGTAADVLRAKLVLERILILKKSGLDKIVIFVFLFFKFDKMLSKDIAEIAEIDEGTSLENNFY